MVSYVKMFYSVMIPSIFCWCDGMFFVAHSSCQFLGFVVGRRFLIVSRVSGRFSLPLRFSGGEGSGGRVLYGFSFFVGQSGFTFSSGYRIYTRGGRALFFFVHRVCPFGRLIVGMFVLTEQTFLGKVAGEL